MSTMRVKSTIDTRDYKRGVKQMQKQNKGFSGGLGKIGGAMKKAFAVVAIIAVIKKLASAVISAGRYATALADMAEQAGVSTEKLQLLGAAAKATGEDMDTVRDALGALKTAQGEALDGDQGMIDNFAALGVSIEEIANMGVDELFVEIGKAVNNAGFSAKEFASLSKVIGEGDALKLRQSFAEAGKGFDFLDEKYTQITNKNAAALQSFSRGWGRFFGNIKNGATNVLGSIVALMTPDVNIANRLGEQEEAAALKKRANLEQYKELQAKQAAERQEQLDKEKAKQDKILAKRAEDVAKIRDSVTIDIQTNQLRRIGGFAGSRTSGALNIARRQMEIQAKIEDYTSSLPKIEKNTENQGLA